MVGHLINKRDSSCRSLVAKSSSRIGLYGTHSSSNNSFESKLFHQYISEGVSTATGLVIFIEVICVVIASTPRMAVFLSTGFLPEFYTSWTETDTGISTRYSKILRFDSVQALESSELEVRVRVLVVELVGKCFGYGLPADVGVMKA